jgi:hypothetical protein
LFSVCNVSLFSLLWGTRDTQIWTDIYFFE